MAMGEELGSTDSGMIWKWKIFLFIYFYFLDDAVRKALNFAYTSTGIIRYYRWF